MATNELCRFAVIPVSTVDVTVKSQDAAARDRVMKMAKENMMDSRQQTNDTFNNQAGNTQTGTTATSKQTEEWRREGEKVVDKTKHAVSEAVTETMDEARNQVTATLADQKTRAADQLSDVAHALRRTGEELNSQEHPTIAQFADAAAEQVERFSGYLKQGDLGDLWQDVRNVAQRQPELFVAGALAAGFLVGRFLKSSSGQTRRSYGNQYPYYQGSQGNYGQYQSGAAYTGSSYTGSQATGSQWSDRPASGSQDIPIAESEGGYGRQW
jgi:hypothetical protein